jgi:hypothetical protein
VVWSTELKEHVGERAELQGGANHRPCREVDFVILRDGKGACQMSSTASSARSRSGHETVFPSRARSSTRAGTGRRQLVDLTLHVGRRDAGPLPVNLGFPS